MTEKAIFAGGCFWCMEESFRKIDGVIDVKCGYTGGKVKNPSYEEVKSGKTGHYEAILVKYDEKKINYKNLLIEFLSNIDPTDDSGQFIDKGSQYRSAIFYSNEDQKKIAEKLLKKLSDSQIFNKEIVVKLIPEKKFYEAEKYHQEYFRTCSLNYRFYKNSSGRVEFTSKFRSKIRKILGEEDE